MILEFSGPPFWSCSGFLKPRNVMPDLSNIMLNDGDDLVGSWRHCDHVRSEWTHFVVVLLPVGNIDINTYEQKDNVRSANNFFFQNSFQIVKRVV